MIIAALLGALTFGACVDSTESASVTAIRNAKAEQLKSVATLNNAKAQAEATLAAAQAQLAAAQAQLIAAEAAALNAATEEQKIANQIAAAEAAATIAKIEAQLELDLLKYQTDLMNAQVKFAEENDKHIAALYAAYTQDLADLKAAQTALATAQATLAAKEKGLASVEETYNKTLAAAQDELAKLQAKQAAKEAEIEALRAAAYGGMSQLEAYAAAEDALETMDALYGEMLVLESTVYRATEAKAALETYTNDPYYIALSTFARDYATLNFSTIDTDEDNVADSYAFNAVTLNNSGVYEANKRGCEKIAIWSKYSTEDVENEDGDYMYTVRNAFAVPTAEGIAAYEAELEKLLSTSEASQLLEAKTKRLEAIDLSTDIAGIIALTEAKNEAIAANAELKIELEAEKAALVYQKNILSGEANYSNYYKEDIAELTSAITAKQKEIDAITTSNNEILSKYDADLKALISKSYNSAAAQTAINNYNTLVEQVEAAQKAYDALAEAYAIEVAILKYIAAEAADFVATYVTEYNAAVVAEFEAGLAYLAKYAEWQEADGLWRMYIAIYYHYETKYPDGSTNSGYIASDDYVQALLHEAVGALDGIKSDVKKQQEKIKGLSLAKDTATAEDAVAVAQAAVVDAEYKVAIAETNLAVTKAALDAAIAE